MALKRAALGRKAALVATLGVLVALVVLDVQRSDPGGSTAARVAAKGDPPAAGAREPAASADVRERAPLALPDRPALNEPQAELFGSQSWQAPPPKLAARAPAAAPALPPNPYRFAGKLLQDGALQVLLSQGDRVFPAKPGETLDGGYRVEAIRETEVTLLYLPLGQRERIPVNSQLGAGEPLAEASAPSAPVAAPTAPAAGSGNQPARLAWQGPEQVRTGAPFSVALRVTSEQPLQSSPMQLSFDPAVLEPLAVRPGRFFGAADRNFSYRVNPQGSIFVGASGRGAAAAADAELLVVTFKPVKPAPAAELSIASLNLQGPAGRPIAFDRLSAYRTTITP
jgi:hypothetical protein